MKNVMRFNDGIKINNPPTCLGDKVAQERQELERKSAELWGEYERAPASEKRSPQKEALFVTDILQNDSLSGREKRFFLRSFLKKKYTETSIFFFGMLANIFNKQALTFREQVILLDICYSLNLIEYPEKFINQQKFTVENFQSLRGANLSQRIWLVIVSEVLRKDSLSEEEKIKCLSIVPDKFLKIEACEDKIQIFLQQCSDDGKCALLKRMPWLFAEKKIWYSEKLLTSGKPSEKLTVLAFSLINEYRLGDIFRGIIRHTKVKELFVNMVTKSETMQKDIEGMLYLLTLFFLDKYSVQSDDLENNSDFKHLQKSIKNDVVQEFLKCLSPKKEVDDEISVLIDSQKITASVRNMLLTAIIKEENSLDTEKDARRILDYLEKNFLLWSKEDQLEFIKLLDRSIEFCFEEKDERLLIFLSEIVGDFMSKVSSSVVKVAWVEFLYNYYVDPYRYDNENILKGQKLVACRRSVCLQYFQSTVRSHYKLFKQLLQMYGEYNPNLYAKIENDSFRRWEQEKDYPDINSLVVGGVLRGKYFFRFLKEESFRTWERAYQLPWTVSKDDGGYGWGHNPIEGFCGVKYVVSQDGKGLVRVTTKVVPGMTVDKFLGITSGSYIYQREIMQQIEAIRGVLYDADIKYVPCMGHAHDDTHNFVVVPRFDENDLWQKVEVYLIDWDWAV